MTDIDKFCEAKSDQLNNIDLIGNNRTIVITKVKVINAEAQGLIVNYEGDNGKPWKPCKTTARIMKEKWGNDIQKWVGKSIELFRDPEVIYGGKKEGGIRIYALSGIPADFETVIRIAKSSTKVIKVKKLDVAVAAAPSPDVVDAGNAAAAGGKDVYTAWLGSLTPDVKSTVKHLHKGWADIAKSVVVAETEIVI